MITNIKKVVIKSRTENDEYGWNEFTEVLVDGESLGEETYQGCPEDRSRGRDFKWVERMLKDLASRLGAEVQIIEEFIER